MIRLVQLVIEAVEHEVDQVGNDSLGALALQKLHKVIVSCGGEFYEDFPDNADAGLPDVKKRNAVKVAYDLLEFAEPIVSIGNQTGEGWFLTGEMVELIHDGVPNIVCTQPFGCLPNHVVGKGVIKALRKAYPASNIVAIDYDPGASEVNQLNRIKLMLSNAKQG